MKWNRKKMFCLLSLCLSALLISCNSAKKKPDFPAYRVITEIRIEYKNRTLQEIRQFYNENSIRVILEYLRHIDPYGRPREDPELVPGRTYHIYVIYSDGTQRLYEQHADRFLRIEDGPWKRIDPQIALYLSGLLGMMPSEAPLPEMDAVPPLIKPQI